MIRVSWTGTTPTVAETAIWQYTGAARVNAENASAALQLQLQQARVDTEAALKKTKAKEAEIRTEAHLTARAAVAEEIAAMERKGTSLELQIEQLTKSDQIKNGA
jgi:hypothetical protein